MNALAVKLAMVIVVLIVSVVACFCYTSYQIGFIKGFKKCKKIDDEILKRLTNKE